MSAYISCDFFKFTVPRDLSDDEIDEMCLELFGVSFKRFDKKYRGRDSYREAYSLSELVNIYRFGTMKNAGTTCISIPATGLNTFGLDIATLGRYALDRGGNITRIDIAADDTEILLDYDELVNLCHKSNFKDRVVTRLNRNSQNGKLNVPEIKTQPVERILFGSEKSDTYLTIYNKQETEDTDYPWRRVELRLSDRDECAAIIRALIADEPEGPLFAGLIRGRLDFKEAGYRPKSRRKTVAWWSDFLHGVEARTLKKIPKSRKIQHISTAPERQFLRSFTRLLDRHDHAGIAEAIHSVQEVMRGCHLLFSDEQAALIAAIDGLRCAVADRPAIRRDVHPGIDF